MGYAVFDRTTKKPVGWSKWDQPPHDEATQVVVEVDSEPDGDAQWDGADGVTVADAAELLAEAKQRRIAELKNESHQIVERAGYDLRDQITAMFKMIDAVANSDAAALAELAPLTSHIKLMHDRFDDARTAVEAAGDANDVEAIELDKTGIDIPKIKLAALRKGQ